MSTSICPLPTLSRSRWRVRARPSSAIGDQLANVSDGSTAPVRWAGGNVANGGIPDVHRVGNAISCGTCEASGQNLTLGDQISRLKCVRGIVGLAPYPEVRLFTSARRCGWPIFRASREYPREPFRCVEPSTPSPLRMPCQGDRHRREAKGRTQWRVE